MSERGKLIEDEIPIRMLVDPAYDRAFEVMNQAALHAKEAGLSRGSTAGIVTARLVDLLGSSIIQATTQSDGREKLLTSSIRRLREQVRSAT